MNTKVLDPEKAMFRDAEKKKAIATRTIEVVKTEFVREYLRDFGELPDLTNPMINMFYNGWLAAQGKREWLSPAQIEDRRRKEAAYKKRLKTVADKKKASAR